MAFRRWGYRFTSEGAERLENDITKIGKAGKKAGDRVGAAGKGSAKGLKVMDNAAKAAGKELDGFANRAGRLGSLTKIIGPAGLFTAAAIGGFLAISAAARNATDDVAAIGDAADRAGIDVDVYEQLKAAITLKGQDAGGLESALAGLNRKVGEARQGIGEAAKVFEQFNISLVTSDGRMKTTTAIIYELADVMQGITDPAQRLAVAQKLMEETGRSLVPVLSEGADGLRELGETAEAAGMLFGGDVIRNAQDLNIEFDKQAAILDTRLKMALIDVAPMVQQLMADFIALLPQIIGNIRALGEFLGLVQKPLDVQVRVNEESFTSAVDSLNTARQRLADALDIDMNELTPDQVQAATERFGWGSAESNARQVLFYENIVKDLQLESATLQTAIREEQALQAKIAAIVAESGAGEAGTPPATTGGGGGGTTELAAYTDLLADAVNRSQELTQKMELIGISDEQQESLKEYNRLIDAAKAKDIDLDAPLNSDQFATRRDQLKALADAYGELTAQAAKYQRIEELSKGATDAMKSNLKSVLLGAKSAREGLASILETMADKLLDLALNPVFDILAAKMAGIGSGVGGGGGGIFSFIGGLFGLRHGGQVPGYAGGGSMKVGGRAQGLIQGPGGKTQDNILLWGSRDEFMQPADAVDHYGLDFMEAIRTLRFPKFAKGGSIGSMSPSLGFAGGSGFAAAAPSFIFGDIHVTTKGDEDGDTIGDKIIERIADALPTMIDGRIAEQTRNGGILDQKTRRKR